MKGFRQVDKQESHSLTNTAGHIVSSLLIAAAGIFWRHTLSALSFLFGSNSILWQSTELPVWGLLLFATLPLLGLFGIYRHRQHKSADKSDSAISTDIPDTLLAFISREEAVEMSVCAIHLHIGEEVARYHIEELRRRELISYREPTWIRPNGKSSGWELTHIGRAYLIERRVLQ